MKKGMKSVRRDGKGESFLFLNLSGWAFESDLRVHSNEI
jgi:hypothetical protein